MKLEQRFLKEFHWKQDGKFSGEECQKILDFWQDALTKMAEEKKQEIGKCIIKLANANGDSIEISINDLLNYADRLINNKV